MTVTNLGLKLPVPAPNAPRFIDLADTRPIVESLVELEALGHWLFGDDYPVYQDLVGGQQMTASGSVTLAANYASFDAGANLATPFDDPGPGSAICVVFKHAGLRNYGAPMGNWSDSANLNWIIWITTVGYYLQEAIESDADGAYGSIQLTPLPTGLATNDWTFFAISWDESTAHIYWGDKSYSMARVKRTLAGKKARFGSVHSAADNLGKIAEVIVFDRYMTGPELSAVRGRSIARMADRGLTVE